MNLQAVSSAAPINSLEISLRKRKEMFEEVSVIIPEALVLILMKAPEFLKEYQEVSYVVLFLFEILGYIETEEEDQ